MTIADSVCVLGYCLFLSFLYIRLNVEVGEEDDERYSITNESIVHPFGEVAVNVERVDGMHDGQTELQLCVCVCVL